MTLLALFLWENLSQIVSQIVALSLQAGNQVSQ
jgi:hypothetical protein